MKDSLLYEFKKGKIAKSTMLEAASIIQSFLTIYTRHQTYHIGGKKGSEYKSHKDRKVLRKHFHCQGSGFCVWCGEAQLTLECKVKGESQRNDN